MAKKKLFDTNKVIPHLDSIDFESELSLYQQNNPDVVLFNLIDEEQVKLSGSKIYYYKFHQTKDYDDVYMEATDKVISRTPILVWGHYDPKVIEENLGKFGIELVNDQLFTFNKSYIIQKLGRAPISGDILKPDFQNIKYEVKEVQEDGFESYGVYHYIVTAQVLRDSTDIVDENLTKLSDEIGRQADELL